MRCIHKACCNRIQSLDATDILTLNQAMRSHDFTVQQTCHVVTLKIALSLLELHT